ncbi:hypothetical protein RJ639_012555 [Escallonia herrerae]|uniref:Chalcone synthase n=1 Tax=Escallonia herrerae TaxID=1293975 RepID=A0AA88VMZ4_9ASTE|nr:hypothetical protein RJ639_012555 [Escallonia herrerae]
MSVADYQLTKLLGLRPFIKRLVTYQQGCFTSGTVLHLAKDLAENNAGAHVLIVYSEITAVTFVDPLTPIWTPSLEPTVPTGVCGADLLLDSDGAIDGHLREVGLKFHLLKDVPGLISKNIEKSLKEAFASIGINVELVVLDRLSGDSGLEFTKIGDEMGGY